MATSSKYPLHRPELLATLEQGDALLRRAMDANRCTLRKGEQVVREWEKSEMVYMLEMGWAARTRCMDDGRRQIISIFLPGDLFAVKSMLITEQPDAIECLTPVEARSIHHGRLRELVETHASIAMRVIFQLGEDERRLHNWVIGLGRGDAEERLALMLLDLHGRLTNLGLATNGEYHLPMKQREIGDHLGLTVIHVNRVLRRLREAGQVTIARGRVKIENLAGLHRTAKPLLDVFGRTRPEFGGSPE
jgi:CRP-like cAMP-binding protein